MVGHLFSPRAKKLFEGKTALLFFLNLSKDTVSSSRLIGNFLAA